MTHGYTVQTNKEQTAFTVTVAFLSASISTKYAIPDNDK